MTPQALGDLLHRLELAPHGPPVHHELRNFPAHVGLSYSQTLELLAEEMSADALEIVAKEFGQPRSLVVGEVLSPLEQALAKLR